jgi:hypothetical protein
MSKRPVKAGRPSTTKKTTVVSDVYDDDEPQDLAVLERQLEYDYNDTPEGSN